MSTTYNEEELGHIKEAAATLSQVHDATYMYIKELLRDGVKSIDLSDIDKAVASFISLHKADPVLFGYPDFQDPEKTFNYTCCISQNSALVHGVPVGNIDFLTTADIPGRRPLYATTMMPPLPPFTIDIALRTKAGWCADLARSYLPVDSSCLIEGANSALDMIVTNSEGFRMVTAMRDCLLQLTAKLNASWTLMDIGIFIRDFARRNNFTVPTQYGGHGIGRELHMDPHVPCTWATGWANEKLKSGMVLCIEPMFIKADSDKLKVDPKDGWTVLLEDESGICAHQEIMVIIHKDYCEVIGV